MSTFESQIVKIRSLEPIPGADFIELAVVGEYRSIVRKGLVKEGDYAVYIPEASLVPSWVQKVVGCEGKLVGPDKNRVKAVKLKGVVSQGLVFPLTYGELESNPPHPFLFFMKEDGSYCEIFINDETLGLDLSAELGIIKYEPPLPPVFSGELLYIPGKTKGYDIENLKKFPEWFVPGEEVVMKEKVHGSCCVFGRVPELNNDELINGNTFVYSKGLGGKGLVFKNNENNAKNIYMRMYASLSAEKDLMSSVVEAFPEYKDIPVYLFGEVFGDVQDLKYGVKGLDFALFDVWVGDINTGKYLNEDELQNFAKTLNVPVVPHIYRGPYSLEVANEHKEGMTMYNGVNIREGVVIRPVKERVDEKGRRVILKHVSDAYLTRKNGTEFQ